MTVEILDVGDKHTRFAAWRVTCGKCGTVFKCDLRDVHVVYVKEGIYGGYQSPHYRIKCPICDDVSGPTLLGPFQTKWESLPWNEWPMGMANGWRAKGWEDVR